jgi:xylitol oxidase
MGGMRNWAGNLEYGARTLHEPTAMDELRELVSRSERLRPLGSRHSFNAIADTTADQVSLARMPRRFEVDARAGTVTVDAATRYGDLCGPLHEAGFALHNMASLPHISVAGACATGTHGSGDRSGSLSTAVSGLELVIVDGEVVRLSRTDNPGTFELAVVGLGALGVITAVTLDIEPAYQVRQDVYEDLPVASVVDHFDELTSAAHSVSLFTEWRGPIIDMVWLKQRVSEGDASQGAGQLLGAVAATVNRHPIPSLPADACTPQLGVAGPWHERLPHFRLDHTPSAGEELQSEFFVAREHAVDAFLAVDAHRDRIAPLIQVTEIRTIAADDLALSMAFERDSVAIHFTWKADWDGVRALLPDIEAALRRFEPRPHWGKLFTMPGDEVRSRYPRRVEVAALAHRHDPNGMFRNDFVDRYLFGEG